MSGEKIFVDERKEMIVELLNRDKKKSVAELCEHFNVSPATMRGDLRDLEAVGLLKRTHGGAISKKKMTYEPTAIEKNDENIEKKIAIARNALQFIQDDDVIILDTGSTVYELAKILNKKKGLTIITYDFKIANYLETNSEAMVVFLGGQLRRNFHCAIGPLTINALKNLSADRLFLGANGLSATNGIYTPNLDLASIKREMIKISDEVIVMSDSTKFEKTSFAKFAEIDGVDVIITDSNLNEQISSKYKMIGIQLELAE